jgi:hypothetical protein
MTRDQPRADGRLPAGVGAGAPAPAIQSRANFAAALRWGFEAAWAGPARRIVVADPDFAAWPLDDPALREGLTAWLRLPQRRLVLLARTYDDVPRRHPRFTAWRADWSHAVDAWVAPPELAADVPTVLVADALCSVQLLDSVHWRGRAAADERLARGLADELDAVLQRCERGFAVRTLGL